jgi:hypothetical protein
MTEKVDTRNSIWARNAFSLGPDHIQSTEPIGACLTFRERSVNTLLQLLETYASRGVDLCSRLNQSRSHNLGARLEDVYGGISGKFQKPLCFR